MQQLILFDFNITDQLENWHVVDDVVMGGRSQGEFYLNDAGHGVFKGTISLENNGGFSSIRYQFGTKHIKEFSKIVLRLKGDGKRYQFRVKSEQSDQHAYITYFQTTGEWQTIEIPLKEMYPTFRGNRLNMPNYQARQMEEIAFLISNKKAEGFQLELEKISLVAN